MMFTIDNVFEGTTLYDLDTYRHLRERGVSREVATELCEVTIEQDTWSEEEWNEDEECYEDTQWTRWYVVDADGTWLWDDMMVAEESTYLLGTLVRWLNSESDRFSFDPPAGKCGLFIVKRAA